MANTFALNESEHFSYGHDPYDLMEPPESYFCMNGADDFVDFGTAPGQTPMQLEFSAHSQGVSGLGNGYIDPSAVAGQETSPITPAAPSQPVRAWPGMHQHQAAIQAKAQADAEAQRQETRKHSMSGSRSSSYARQGASDPYVEDSIARLLDRMRHSSVKSSAEDDDNAPEASGHGSHMTRTRKDEEDMDEDERLLASEEGKKLSSRERRQLRNKVSARAFRSRRKGISLPRPLLYGL